MEWPRQAATCWCSTPLRTLNPTNNYPAATQFNGLTFGPAAGSFVLAGNSITLGGNLADNTPVLVQSVNLPLMSAAAPEISVANNAFLTVGGAISGNFGWIKTGNGTLTLAASNTFAGSVSIAAGTVRVSADNNFGAVPLLFRRYSKHPFRRKPTLNATGSFTLNSNRGIALGPLGGTIDVSSGQTLMYGGVITFNGTGTGGLTKTHFGTLTLSGANNYIGRTNVHNVCFCSTLPMPQLMFLKPILLRQYRAILGGATAGLGQNNSHAGNEWQGRCKQCPDIC